MPIERLEVIEIVQPIASGMTQPFQCRLDDDQLYAVKGRGALARGLIAEAYAAELGRAFGLPIPPSAVVTLSSSLIEAFGDPLAMTALGPGELFASRWAEPVDIVSAHALHGMGRTLRAKLYVFDHWIGNGDRSLTEDGGNANLLIRLADQSLIVIDHNLAFSPHYSPDELRFHACRTAWLGLTRDDRFLAKLADGMSDALASVAQLERELPEEWLESAPGFCEDIAETLRRFEQPQFWSELDG